MIIQSKGHCIACGVLPRDAEYRTVGSKQSSLTTFGIKVDEAPIDGQDKPQAKWLDCKCWHRLAKYAAMLEKGDTVLVVGDLVRESWTDKTTGERKEKTVLACEMVVPQSWVEDLEIHDEAADNGDDFTQLDDDSDVPF